MSNTDVITGSGLDGQVSTQQEEVLTVVDAPTLEQSTQITESPRFEFPLIGAWKDQITEMLTRPVLLASTTWTNGSPPASIDVYDTMVSNTTIAYKLTNAYKFRPRGYEITIRANGSPYLFGLLMVAAIPDFTTAFLQQTAAKTTLTSFSCFPNYAEIDAAGDSVITIKAPHVFNRDLILTAQVLGVMGLYFFEAAPLGTANSAGPTPSVDINIYCKFIEPTLIHNTGLNAWYATMKKSKKSIKTIEDDGEAQGLLSKPLAAMHRGFNEMKDIPVIGTLATSFSTAAALGSKVASFFGFASPPLNKVYKPVIVRGCGQLAVCDTMDMGEQLSLHREVSTVIDPSLLGVDNTDYMDLLTLARKWSCAYTFQWADTSAEGTQLATIGVTPLLSTINGSIQAPTWLRFVSQPFEYYRGSIEYRIVIPASKFHVGRMQIVFDPVCPPFGPDPTNLSLNWLVDLSDTTEITFVVPYSWYYPAFKLYSGADYWISASPPQWGALTFYARSKLRSGLTASTLNVLVFIRAGPDAEWYQPTLLYSNQYTAANLKNVVARFPTATSTLPTAAGYQWFGTMEAASKTINTIENQTPGFVSQFIWSDRVQSIRELIKRFSFIETKLYGSSSYSSYWGLRDRRSQPYIATNNSSQSCISLDAPDQFDWQSYFLPAFLYYRGGTRHKITRVIGDALIFKDTTNTIAYTYGAPNRERYGQWATLAVNQGASGPLAGATYAVEVLNPWNDHVFARRNDAVVNAYDATSGVIAITPSQAGQTIQHFTAAGDDMSYFYPICPPLQYKFNASY